MGKLEIAGQKFNRLTAIKFDGVDSLHNAQWLFKCDCGNEVVKSASKVKRGSIKSCGCLIHENTTIGDKTRSHGMSQAKIYKVWRGMNDRCERDPRYIARKTVVCSEWKTFPPFYEWAMLNGYKEGLSIDRIDNNGNYEPTNCRWTTSKVQSNNCSTNVYLTYRGVKKTQNEWADYFGITGESIRYWRKKGLSEEKIIEHFIKRRAKQ